MKEASRLSRRAFLYGAAASAGSAMLAACSGGGSSSKKTAGAAAAAGPVGKGSATKPLPKPTSFHQSPSLAGKQLPPVTQRLPENPYVVPHRWLQRGRYGGTLNTVAFSSTGATGADSTRQFFYGHSALRWLNDGLDIGPGLAESWTSNSDASEWTFTFRKGVRWSDGHLFSTDDILFWWEDLVLPGHFGQVPPDDTRSGKNTIAKITAVDQWTLKLTFDAPAPLVADRLAMWPNGAVGINGPIWVLPKHYLKQFHPKYNKKVSNGWDEPGGLWAAKSDWMRNPDCPTLIGYKCKSFNSTTIVLERNPYYYAVTKEGDQLPYIDEFVVNVVSNAQVIKLQVQQGKTDFCQGVFSQIDLSDVSGLSRTKSAGGYEIVYWNSGSGTGSIFFLNYDYPDATYRSLFREPKFRQAISHAFNRELTQKNLYFQTGTITTGTSSPDVVELSSTPQGKSVYTQWRDSYKSHDPAKAKALLAQLGLKDSNGDGYVEFPDGKKLTIRIDYSADISPTEAAKDDQLVNDCKAVGLRMVRNPISPTAYNDEWQAGKLMARTNWEDTDTPSILAIPVFVVPIASSHWAPLEGEYYVLQGTANPDAGKNADPWKSTPPRLEPDPNGPVAKLWKLYKQALLEPDKMKRMQAVWDMAKIHMTDGPFIIGPVANFPQVQIVKNGLNNVPRQNNLARGGLVNAWATPCPASHDPETWYWQNPGQHT